MTEKEINLCAKYLRKLSEIESGMSEELKFLGLGPNFDPALKKAYHLVIGARCALKEAYVENTPSREEAILSGRKYNYSL